MYAQVSGKQHCKHKCRPSDMTGKPLFWPARIRRPYWDWGGGKWTFPIWTWGSPYPGPDIQHTLNVRGGGVSTPPPPPTSPVCNNVCNGPMPLGHTFFVLPACGPLPRPKQPRCADVKPKVGGPPRPNWIQLKAGGGGGRRTSSFQILKLSVSNVPLPGYPEKERVLNWKTTPSRQ